EFNWPDAGAWPDLPSSSVASAPEAHSDEFALAEDDTANAGWWAAADFEEIGAPASAPEETVENAAGSTEAAPSEEPASLGQRLPRVPIPSSVTVGICWLAGSSAWLMLLVSRTRRFYRLLRHARPAPPALREEARRLAWRLGLADCPGVWLVPGRVSPLVW